MAVRWWMHCKALVVGTKAVIQSVSSHTQILAVAGRRPLIWFDSVCDCMEACYEWSCGLLTDVFKLHRSNVVNGVRRCATAMDHGRWHQFECYWNLSMLDFGYRPVSPAFKSVKGRGRCLNVIDDSNAVNDRQLSNACEGVSEKAILISDCWL